MSSDLDRGVNSLFGRAEDPPEPEGPLESAKPEEPDNHVEPKLPNKSESIDDPLEPEIPLQSVGAGADIPCIPFALPNSLVRSSHADCLFFFVGRGVNSLFGRRGASGIRSGLDRS